MTQFHQLPTEISITLPHDKISNYSQQQMKPFLLLIFILAAQVSYCQPADSTDWCQVFQRIGKTGLLTQQNDTTGPFVCNRKYLILVADSCNPVPAFKCDQNVFSVVSREDLFFCSVTEFNRLISIVFEKKSIVIVIDIYGTENLKRIEFTVPKNVKKRVKAREINFSFLNIKED